MNYVRMPIEVESPEEMGYDRIRCNLSESSVADRRLGDLRVDLNDLVLCYGDHRGDPALRELVAGMAPNITADDVLICNGAAGALFIIASSLLSKGDHIVVLRPNYATNIETPRAIGCDISFVDLRFEDGFRLDLDRIAAAIRPETRYVSVTYPHNPTGVMPDLREVEALVALTARHGCLLLFDETYREMSFGEALPVAASLGPHIVSVSSLSKTYGIPGIRTGWLTTRDADLMTLFLAAKEQIGISGSVVDERIARAALEQRNQWLPQNNARIRAAFDRVKAWIASEAHIEWVEPQGGCVCFPRIRPDSGVDTDAFYRALFDQFGTYVGPGHWFEQSDNHFRLGYGWPKLAELEQGLANISAAIRAVR